LDDLNYIKPKGNPAMASRAVRLKNEVPKAVFTVEQLFAAAFGPEPLEYHRKSLFGWRPLPLNPGGFPFKVENPVPTARTLSPEAHPGVKVYETEALIVVEVELPAIEEESLYLEISGSMLIIRGNRLFPEATHRTGTARRADKEVQRRIQLPVIARPGEVRARLNGNIIRVMIRKRHPAEE
jgi:HSP20 family molecular chaperone IbpA